MSRERPSLFVGPVKALAYTYCKYTEMVSLRDVRKRNGNEQATDKGS